MTFRFSPLPRFSLLSLITLTALTGCGGGGGNNGPDRPTPTPTPTPTSQTRSCTVQTYTPNYAVNPDPDFKLLRWQVFPLRVFFIQDAENTVARRTLAIQGFDEWVKATNNGVTYKVVSKESDANVTVKFSTYSNGSTLGFTNLSFYTGSDTISFADVNIGITGDNRNDGITATHEFGHALGIYGHSPNSDDLMYFQGNDAGCGCITPADLNTVLTAYCGDFNKNANARLSPHRGELKTVTIE